MALIAALLPNATDRDSLRKSVPQEDVVWADDWKGLFRLVRARPAAAAVADVHAEARKDGALRVYRFVERYPRTPLIAWGELDGRDLYRLGKAGAHDVVMSRDAANHELVAERLSTALAPAIVRIVDDAIPAHVAEEGRAVVRYAARRIPDHIQVPDVADAHEVSVSTLERHCERWGLPTPGRLLLWLRVLHALHWLLEPGRSVESVARQLGYSSGAALRRAIKATVGGRPTPLRTPEGLEHAVSCFAAECAAVAAPAPPSP